METAQRSSTLSPTRLSSGHNLTTTGTSKLTASNSGINRLDGVNFSGKIDLPTSAFLRVTNNTTFVAGSTLDMAAVAIATNFRVDKASLDNWLINANTDMATS